MSPFVLSEAFFRNSHLLQSCKDQHLFHEVTSNDFRIPPAVPQWWLAYKGKRPPIYVAGFWLSSFLAWAVQEGFSSILTKDLLEEHLRFGDLYRRTGRKLFLSLEEFIFDFCEASSLGGGGSDVIGMFAAPVGWTTRSSSSGPIMSKEREGPHRKVWFASSEINLATKSFSRRIGHGQLGTVYYGFMMEKAVAVKRLNSGSLQRVLREVAVYCNIRPTSRVELPIVKLVGCCASPEDPLTIYEYVPHGNLKQHLGGEKDDIYVRTNHSVRLKIAIDVAAALVHLHYNCESPIYHRNVKSSNILLDDHYQAKLADLSLAVIVKTESVKHTPIALGAQGYIDPLYEVTNVLDDKTDVYSFGVVLMELATLLPGWDTNRQPQRLTGMIPDTQSAVKHIQPTAAGPGRDTALRMITIAVHCCSIDLNKRPRIDEVHAALTGLYVGSK